MATLTDFYTITSATELTEGKIIYTISINASHAIYEGHFPNMPVTPGVVQLEIVKQLLGKTIGQEVKLSEMNSCKYLAILDPTKESIVDFELALTENEDGFKVNAVVKGLSVYSKIAASYVTLS